ncbi:hypothetical protein SAMN04487972_1109 [Paracoccus halophilus]|uniref:Universal stress protein family protein n=1 Tax=Paracoccus halophilus TaxID=376733 RepID=A0A099EU11_9RHOB|nr:universal stress protein [Paracoccus halophilus]KGJ01764.1 hypothetical protein IT41_19305 [Paracoccus halophilus]SFA52696.1 hypothetical protein SAMN04487972_1109 [Paracoccus halophilus]
MIKSILVACTGEKPSAAAIAHAVDVAGRFEAHLTGILPLRLGLSQLGVPGWFPGELKSQITDTINEKNGDIREKFHALAGASLDAGRVHWINSNATADQTLVNYARMFDLTVVSSPPDHRSSTDIHPDLVALQSGLPILVVPDGADAGSLSKPAVIAWDGQRAATRALRDSLALLRGRPSVSILSVAGSKLGKPLPGIDVRTVLQRHGIDAEWHEIERGSQSVTDRILGYCREVDAGLLVMGAYENSKFSEDLFGGVTRDTLWQNKSVPVLLSH